MLLIGLQKIRNIKSKLKNLDVRIDETSCKDLVFALDLESSLISSESTVLSAIEREESRGAHQRSDFPKINREKNFNVFTKLNKNNDQLEIKKKPIKKIRQELNDLVSNAKQDNIIKNKLLEKVLSFEIFNVIHLLFKV